MAKQSWERQREALGRLTRVLVEERRGGLFGEALEHLLDATGAVAGSAYTATESQPPHLELVAERQPPECSSPSSVLEAVRVALHTLADRALQTRKRLLIEDLARDTSLDASATAELALEGLHSAIAVPIVLQRQVLGVFVLLAANESAFDSAATAALQIGSHIVALATERDKRAERELTFRAELAEAARMASLGLVTATVAHELRTPLNALEVQLREQEQLLERLRRGTSPTACAQEMGELLSEMKSAMTQVGTFLAQLSSVSQRDAGVTHLELSEVVAEALALADLELKRRSVRVQEQFAKECVTNGNRASLVQIVTNLLFYAADASLESGRRQPTITIRTWTDDARVGLAVEDTGSDIPDSDISQIFEPFAPQRRKSPYAGLALTICSHVVTSHRGHIEVVNLEDGGASIRVLLPRVAADEVRTVSPVPAGSHSTTSTLRGAYGSRIEVKNVFVVDDDDLFCRTIRRSLKPHDVRIAATASEAEIALLDSSYTPQLVVCDLGLPGFGGDVLHNRIRGKRPDVAARFVFVTGGACSKSEADYVRASGCPTMLKPIETSQLLRVLDASESSTAVAEPVSTLSSESSTHDGLVLPAVHPRDGTKPA